MPDSIKSCSLLHSKWPLLMSVALGGDSIIRRIVEILNVHFRGAEDADIGHRTVGYRKPERAILVVLVNEVNALKPEGRILGRLALNTNDRVFVGVHPDSASGEIFVLGLGLDRNHVRQAAPDVLRPGHFKRVV